MKNRGWRHTVSRAGGILFLLLAFLLGALGAAFGFLVAAALTTSVPWMCAAGLGLCLAVATTLGALAGILLSLPWRRLALGAGLGTTAAVVLVSSWTVFQPLVPAAEIPPREVPPEVAFWELPTGSHIAYLKIASATGGGQVPVVYLHGGPGAGIVSVPELTRAFSFPTALGHDVYFYDQIGGGLSGRLSDITAYTVERHVADLEAIRRRIGAETFVLIGESWGAVLAAHYLAAHPARLDALVLVSPGSLGPRDEEDRDSCELQGHAELLRQFLRPRTVAAMFLLEIRPEAAHAFLPDAEADAFMSRLLSQFLVEGVCDASHFPTGEDFGFGMWGNVMTDEDLEAGTSRLDGALEQIKVPVLILRGECDYCRPEAARQYATLLANSTLVDVADAGHFLWLEKPDVLADVAGSFLLAQRGE